MFLCWSWIAPCPVHARYFVSCQNALCKCRRWGKCLLWKSPMELHTHFGLFRVWVKRGFSQEHDSTPRHFLPARRTSVNPRLRLLSPPWIPKWEVRVHRTAGHLKTRLTGTQWCGAWVLVLNLKIPVLVHPPVNRGYRIHSALLKPWESVKLKPGVLRELPTSHLCMREQLLLRVWGSLGCWISTGRKEGKVSPSALSKIQHSFFCSAEFSKKLLV